MPMIPTILKYQCMMEGQGSGSHALSLDLALCACHMAPVVCAPVSCLKRNALKHSVSHLHSGIMGDLNFLLKWSLFSMITGYISILRKKFTPIRNDHALLQIFWKAVYQQI